MKKILSLILTFLMVVLIAGCGAEKTTDKKTDSKSDKAAEDYVYTTVKDEYILLTLYKGNDKDIVNKQKIKGLPVKTIGSGCFASAEIESGVVPDSVKEIWDSAFLQCKKLSEVTLSKNITVISAKTFEGCISLSEIEIPENVTTIDAYAFLECESLKTLTIPKAVNNVGTYAFSNSGITELKFLGDAPNTIGNDIIKKDESVVIYHPTGAIGWDNKALEGYTLKTY